MVRGRLHSLAIKPPDFLEEIGSALNFIVLLNVPGDLAKGLKASASKMMNPLHGTPPSYLSQPIQQLPLLY